ncbi:hypothetical protein T492DRAFT_881664, partial [Pavlovales sp. CCMP2436]
MADRVHASGKLDPGYGGRGGYGGQGGGYYRGHAQPSPPPRQTARERSERMVFERLVGAAVRVQSVFRGWTVRRYADRINEEACAQWIKWHLACNQFDEARELGWEGDELEARTRNRERARAALRVAVLVQAVVRRRQASAIVQRRRRAMDAEAAGGAALVRARELLDLALEPCCAVVYARALRLAGACDSMETALELTLGPA